MADIRKTQKQKTSVSGRGAIHQAPSFGRLLILSCWFVWEFQEHTDPENSNLTI